MTAQAELFPAAAVQPLKEGPWRLTVIGTVDACRAAPFASMSALGTALWCLTDEDLPPGRLEVVFATPRVELPTAMRRELDELERRGALREWRQP